MSFKRKYNVRLAESEYGAGRGTITITHVTTCFNTI